MFLQDTYTAQATVGDVRRATTNHKNLESSNTGLLVFGNGDGGGGPLAKMLENVCLWISVCFAPVLIQVICSSVASEQLQTTLEIFRLWIWGRMWMRSIMISKSILKVARLYPTGALFRSGMIDVMNDNVLQAR